MDKIQIQRNETENVWVNVTCIVPPGVGHAAIKIGAYDTGYAWHYDPPQLARVWPQAPLGASGNVPIFLQGMNFGPGSMADVHFAFSGSRPSCCDNVVVVNDSFASCFAPPGYGTANVSLSVGGQESNTVGVEYDFHAVITTWAMAPGVLRLTGSGFLPEETSPAAGSVR
jgi:hypothetical protein